jgi:hypothetical protein
MKEIIEVDGLRFELASWELKKPREEVIADKQKDIDEADEVFLPILREAQKQHPNLTVNLFGSWTELEYEGRELRFRYTDHEKEWEGHRYHFGEPPKAFHRTHLLLEDTKKSDKHSTVYFALIEEVIVEDAVDAIGKWVKDVDKRVARGKKAKARRKDKKIEEAHPGYYVSLALEEELKERGYKHITSRGEYIYGEKNGTQFRMWVRGWDDRFKDEGELAFGTLHSFGGQIGSQWVDRTKKIKKRPEDPSWDPKAMACEILDTMEHFVHFTAELAKTGWEE